MKAAVLVVLAIAATTAASEEPRRSLGYAGSTPVGLESLVAFTAFDCTALNAKLRTTNQRVPLADECRLDLPSPNGRWVVRTVPATDGSTLTASGGLVVRGLSQPTILLWKPDSTGFLLNGGEGSGQVSHLRYFYRESGRWHRSTHLADVASRLYRRRFDCRGGSKSYTNTSGWNWTSTGLLRVIVQEGVHSEGCVQPHEDHNVLFEVIGNPVSGRVASAREIDRLS